MVQNVLVKELTNRPLINSNPVTKLQIYPSGWDGMGWALKLCSEDTDFDQAASQQKSVDGFSFHLREKGLGISGEDAAQQVMNDGLKVWYGNNISY